MSNLYPPKAIQLPLSAATPELASDAPIAVKGDVITPAGDPAISRDAGSHRHKRRASVTITPGDAGRRPSLEMGMPPASSLVVTGEPGGELASPETVSAAARCAITLTVTCAACGGLAGERVTYTTGRYEMVCACGNIQSVIWPAEGEPEGIDE